MNISGPFQISNNDESISRKDLFIPPTFSELNWEYPPGSILGTFEDYISEHPYTPATFYLDRRQLNNPVSLQSTFSILVHNTLYPSISSKLIQYSSDIENEGYSVLIDTLKGGNPDDVKNWVIDRYLAGSCGILFIGDIPAAWAEVSGSQFPCDLFYMDVDGEWLDTNNDEIFDVHTEGSGDMGPEIFIGRLYSSTLSWDTETSMVSDYFEKVHAYRSGTLTVPFRGVEYVDEDWYNMDIFLDEVYYDNVTRYDYGHKTTASGYLEMLSESQHFVTVCAHSYPGGHHFSTKPTEAVSYAHVYVFSPTERQGKLLIGCDDGIKVWLNTENIFTKDVYSGYRADQYRIDISLNEGWNSLLCKISQESGDYKFSARFTDTNFQTFTDLIYQTNDPKKDSIAEPEYIRSWLINGFHQDISDNFWEYLSTNYLQTSEPEIFPNLGDIMGGIEWTLVESSGPYIDLNEQFDETDFGVSYAFVKIISPEAMDCHLYLGYDDGIKAWLNGEEIISDNRYGGFEYDMTALNVTLAVGENHLLVKISEWMGEHGFSARFCDDKGHNIEGLLYEPASKPISYISTWLINGVYENPDRSTRLSTDYIPDESTVQPIEGQTSSYCVWEKGIGDGRPFDLGVFFDRGDWIYSETIQQHDPPVLFYNLFSCGPGRFTDTDYLAGSYIFDTSYGLISVASAKSGSMLNFKDFSEPLSKGKTIGEAFLEWFDAQEPYELWEKEWYYGMVLNGDPLLRLFNSGSTSPSIKISRPDGGIYLNDSKISSFPIPVIIGDVTIHAQVLNPGYGIDNVSFYIDDQLFYTDYEYPFTFLFEAKKFGRTKFDVVLSDSTNQQNKDSLILWKFF